MTKTRMRRATPRAQHVGAIDTQEAWPITEEPRTALGEPEIGLDQNDFYRWRRNRSEPPPAFATKLRGRR